MRSGTKRSDCWISCADGEATRSTAVPDDGIAWMINAIAENSPDKARHRLSRKGSIQHSAYKGSYQHSAISKSNGNGEPTPKQKILRLRFPPLEKTRWTLPALRMLGSIVSLGRN